MADPREQTPEHFPPYSGRVRDRRASARRVVSSWRGDRARRRRHARHGSRDPVSRSGSPSIHICGPSMSLPRSIGRHIRHQDDRNMTAGRSLPCVSVHRKRVLFQFTWRGASHPQIQPLSLLKTTSYNCSFNCFIINHPAHPGPFGPRCSWPRRSAGAGRCAGRFPSSRRSRRAWPALPARRSRRPGNSRTTGSPA